MQMKTICEKEEEKDMLDKTYFFTNQLISFFHTKGIIIFQFSV